MKPWRLLTLSLAIVMGLLLTGDGLQPASRASNSSGIAPAAVVRGIVWHDRDRGGVEDIDPGEEGVSGVSVLLRNPSGQILAQAQTDSAGQYQFTGLSPQTAILTIVIPPGWQLTTPPPDIWLAFGDVTLTVNFGLVAASTPTASPTSTASPTPTAVPFSVHLPLIAARAGAHPTLTPTSSSTPTALSTATPSQTPSTTPTPTLTSAPSSTPTTSPSPTSTRTPTITPTPSVTRTPTPTPTATPTLPPTANLLITFISYDSSNEYVSIRNDGAAGQIMTSWSLLSVVGSQSYYFPFGYTLAPGATVRIHSGPNATNNPPASLLWTNAYIWNNDGDKAILYNAQGQPVDTYCYRDGCP